MIGAMETMVVRGKRVVMAAAGIARGSATLARRTASSTAGDAAVKQETSRPATLLSWGACDGLALGLGRETSTYPASMPYFVDTGPNMAPLHLALGTNHSAIILQDTTSNDPPRLLMTGLNTQRQLGSATGKQFITKFKAAPLPDNVVPHDVDCGRCHTVALSDAGVFATGLNSLGQCGAGPRTRTLPSWKAVLPDTDANEIVSVTCGLDHTLLLLQNGTVLVSGWSADGQTGISGATTENVTSFTRIEGLDRIVKVSCVGDTSLFLDDAGHVFACGNSEYGQTGLGNDHDQVTTATRVDSMPEPVVDIAAGGPGSLFLGRSGTVYGVGLSVFGNRLVLAPEPLTLPEAATAVFAGGRHFLAVLKDGVYTWGSGALGSHGHTDSQHKPHPIIDTPRRLVAGRALEVACGSEATLLSVVAPKEQAPDS